MTNDLKEYIDSLDIQEIRLITGEHIMSEVLQDNDEFILKDPLQLVNMGNGNMSYMEWFPYTSSSYFVIDKSHILASGSMDFESKALFCKITITNNVRKELIGKTENTIGSDTMHLLNDLNEILSKSKRMDLDEEPVTEYDSWEEHVDTNVVH